MKQTKIYVNQDLKKMTFPSRKSEKPFYSYEQ